MSVIIKGMKMPKTCEECNLESFCDLWVLARKMSGEWKPRVKATIRHPDCPLVESADVAEVVRCKDCEFGKKVIDNLYSCNDWVFCHAGGFYCANGKRREDA